MSLFFLMVFVVYGGMQAYIFLRARSAFAFGVPAGIAIAAFMLLMLFAIFLIRTLERHEYEVLARALSYIAYCWMVGVFLFFCSSILLDFIGLITRAGGWIFRSEISAFLVSGRMSFLASLCVVLAICGYGYFEAWDICTEKIRIETTKLPAGTDRLTIAQISDVHLGLVVRCARLEKMLEVVSAANPDIVVSTGDLVDAQINHLVGLDDLLRGIKAPHGNYAVTGNHEYYAGVAKALAFTKKAGFTVLRNETVTAGPIIIAGVDDRTAVQMNRGQSVSEKELLAKLPRDRFILFLKHQPNVDQSTIGFFDLQLSGHTHKGQIYPFRYVSKIFYPLDAGDFDLGKGSRLHVSRGTGTWGPPIRFLSYPEVTIIELVRKAVP